MRALFLLVMCGLLYATSTKAGADEYGLGFTTMDYEYSLRTGSLMTPIQLPLPSRYANQSKLSGSYDADTQASAGLLIELPSDPNIIGGTNARRGEFDQYTLVLITDGRGNIVSYCGGTLISHNRVLTAAHCAQGAASNYFLLPKFYSFSDAVTASDFLRVSSIAIHPNYDAQSFDYDVAVLKLIESVPIAPAKVHVGNNDFVGDTATVIGIGLTATQPVESPDTLQRVPAPIIANDDCNDIWQAQSGIRPITPRMMCAGYDTDARGSCSGDSGGPLWNNIRGERVVVGTVSFGLRNCEAQNANQGYVRLSEMRDFLQLHSPETDYITSNEVPPVGALMLLMDAPSVPFNRDDMYPRIPRNFSGKYAISFETDLGYIIEPGTTYLYTQQNSELEVALDSFAGLKIGIKGWGEVMGSPRAERVWTLGMDHRYNSDFTPRNRLSVSQNRGFVNCGNQTEYEIHQLEFSGNQIVKLAAEFTQTCSAHGAALRGSIYFDAARPIAVFQPPTHPDLSIYPELPELEYQGAVARLVKVSNQSREVLSDRSYSIFDSNFRADRITTPSSDEQQGLRFIVESPHVGWTFTFRRGTLAIDPDKETPLKADFYSPALSRVIIGQTSHQVFMAAEYRDCDDLSAELMVFNIENDAAGRIEKLRAGFSVSCPGIPDVTTYGSIDFDSSLPPATYVPPPLPAGPVSPELPPLEYAGGVFRVTDEANIELFAASSIDSNIEVNKGPDGQSYNFSVRVRNQGRLTDLRFTKYRLNIDPTRYAPITPGVYANGAVSMRQPDGNVNFPCDFLASKGFNVYDIEYDGSTKITKLVADFELICSETSEIFKGSIHYDESLPAFVFPELVIPEGELQPSLPELIAAGGVGVFEQGDDVVELSSSNGDVAVESPGNGSMVTYVWREQGFTGFGFGVAFQRGSLLIDPERDQRLTPGIYRNALRLIDDPSPGFAENLPPLTQCDSIQDATFRVFEIEYDSNGKVERLKADFERTCNDFPEILRGSINFDLTL